MAISSPGLGSGLDIQSIVTQLVALEQRPLATLQAKAVTLNSQLSSLGLVQSKLSVLQDAAAALAKPDLWGKTTGTSSDAASVSISTSGNAASGEYAVSVAQLAKAQSVASAGFEKASSVVGGGRLRIEVGRYATLDPDPDGESPKFSRKTDTLAFDIDIDADSTLETIRNKINDAKAGVTASIVNDATGARLVLRSNETGAANEMRVREIDAAGVALASPGALAGLTYDPSGGATPAMQQTVPAQDALATINGLNLVSSSNTFKDVAEGMSFTALKLTTGDATLKVANDSAAFKSAIGKFTAAYNDANSTLRGMTKYDADSGSAGVLQGDRTALAIQDQLRGLVQSTAGTSTDFRRLSDLGLEMQRDGSLTTNDSKLSEALKNPLEVGKALASASDAPAAERGIAALFKSFASVVTGSDGTLTTRTESLNNRIRQNVKETDRFNDRIEQTRARLLRQYSALDTRMASLTALSSYVTQQITSWNRSTD